MTDEAGASERATGAGQPAIVEVLDEREPLAESALQLIGATFDPADRQPLSELRGEIGEKRMGLVEDFHLLAAVSRPGTALGTVAGMYLENVNAGFVTYLAVDPGHRRRKLAPALRSALIEVLRGDARGRGRDDLDWVVGEVRADSRWLLRLVEARGAVAFDLDYFRPGTDPGVERPAYILYREPVGNSSRRVPALMVRRLLYSIYRRGYRIRYPMANPGFQAMLAQLGERETVGEHPGIAHPALPAAPPPSPD